MIKNVTPGKDASGIPPCICIHTSNPDFENYQSYLTDESKLSGGQADSICIPNSESQLADLIVKANTKQIPVTISAARTGITGGAIPFSGMLISLEKMNKLLQVQKKSETWTLNFQPGINLNEIGEILKTGQFPEKLDENSDQLFFNESSEWFYPPDPTEKTAHLGGTVATNASGAHSYLYGPTRTFIEGLRIVLMDGTILQIKRGEHIAKRGDVFRIQINSGEIELPVPAYHFPQIKNTAGYFTADSLDLIDLFIGSEGTLGIFTEIEISLKRRPEMIVGCLAFFPEDILAFQFVENVKKTNNVSPSALEYFGPRAIQFLREKKEEEGASSSVPDLPENAISAIYFEQELTEDQLDDVFAEYDELLQSCQISMDETWAAMDEKELRQMADFRHLIPESINAIIGQRQREIPELHKISTDFVVPEGKLPEFMERMCEELDSLGLDYAVFGHIGDNHLHVNMLPQNCDELNTAKKIYFEYAKKAVDIGGTISGEHGIGKLKKALMCDIYSDDAIAEMKQIKSILDPHNLLNQGTLF